MADTRSPHSSQMRYPPELRERAVRMVFETMNCPGFDGGLDGWVYATSLDCSNSR